MVKVGDHIRLSSGKGADREGVVAAVTGSMVRVRWPSDDETTVIPAPGTLTVLASSRPKRPAGKKAVPKKTATTKKAAPTKKATTKKAAPTKKATTKKAATKKATTSKKGVTKTRS